MKIRGLFFEDSNGEVWIDPVTRANAAADIARFREMPFAGYERPRVVDEAALAVQIALAPGAPLTLKRFLELVSCFELIKADWFHAMADREAWWRRQPEQPEEAYVFDQSRSDALRCEARAQLLDFMAEDPTDDFRTITMLLQRSRAFDFIAASLACRSRVLHPEDARALLKYVRANSFFGKADGRKTVLGEALALFASSPTVLESISMLVKVEAHLCTSGMFLELLLGAARAYELLGPEAFADEDDASAAPSELDGPPEQDGGEHRPTTFPERVLTHAMASAAGEYLLQFLEEAADLELEETADRPH